MKRNAFGQPRPATLDEIDEALGEVGLEAEEAQAIITDDAEGPPPNCFFALISHMDDGSREFETLAFPDKEALIEGLNGLGIVLIDDCT
jgi:hypothetical protein